MCNLREFIGLLFTSVSYYDKIKTVISVTGFSVDLKITLVEMLCPINITEMFMKRRLVPSLLYTYLFEVCYRVKHASHPLFVLPKDSVFCHHPFMPHQWYVNAKLMHSEIHNVTDLVIFSA